MTRAIDPDLFCTEWSWQQRGCEQRDALGNLTYYNPAFFCDWALIHTYYISLFCLPNTPAWKYKQHFFGGGREHSSHKQLNIDVQTKRTLRNRDYKTLPRPLLILLPPHTPPLCLPLFSSTARTYFWSGVTLVRPTEGKRLERWKGAKIEGAVR